MGDVQYERGGRFFGHEISVYDCLAPAYGDKSLKPKAVDNLRLSESDGKLFLSWSPEKPGKTESETDAVKYMVYQFFPLERQNLEDSQAIIAMTPLTRVLVGEADDKSLRGSTFVVTSVDRMNRESDPMKIKR